VIIDKCLDPGCKLPRLEVATAREGQRIDLNVKAQGPRNNKRIDGKGTKRSSRGVLVRDRGPARKNVKKFGPFLDLCVSSLRRGHANLLCIVPILSDVSKETTTALRSGL
jgi:hypothetical protein